MQTIQFLDVAFEIQTASNILASTTSYQTFDEPILVNSPLILELIIRECCESFGIPPERLKDKSRRRNLVECRQSITWIARKHTALSQIMIADRIGQDRSTLVHSKEVMDSLIWQKADAGMLTLEIESELIKLIYNKPLD